MGKCKTKTCMPKFRECVSRGAWRASILKLTEGEGQRVTISVSGELSASPQAPGGGDQPFKLKLRADLGDFQNRLTSVMQSELNKSDRCGERIEIQNAALSPAAPAGHLTVQLHFEKWVCVKLLGKDSAKRLVGGNATAQVTLTPKVVSDAGAGQSVRLDAELGTIDADGSLGEVLRSGSVGPALRDKIRKALLKAVEKSTDLDGVVPIGTKHLVTIESVAFADGGRGRLELHLTAWMQVPGAQVSGLPEQFGNRK
jgi:hypothetical protein